MLLIYVNFDLSVVFTYDPNRQPENYILYEKAVRDVIEKKFNRPFQTAPSGFVGGRGIEFGGSCVPHCIKLLQLQVMEMHLPLYFGKDALDETLTWMKSYDTLGDF